MEHITTCESDYRMGWETIIRKEEIWTKCSFQILILFNLSSFELNVKLKEIYIIYLFDFPNADLELS